MILPKMPRSTPFTPHLGKPLRGMNASSGICLTTKGNRCGSGRSLVDHINILNAALLIAVKGKHHFVVEPDFCGGRADTLFRQHRREYIELKKSAVPWYSATCTSRRISKPSQLCGWDWKVPPDFLSASSPLRLLPMPAEEIRGHEWQVQCNDPHFVLHGEGPGKCLSLSMGLADAPLHRLRAQVPTLP